MPNSTITDVAGLRELYAEPTGAVAKKLQTKLGEHYHRFIAASPFLVLGTSGDVSPRGNHLGFVQVLDDNTVLLPDRRGNNLIDSFQNIVKDLTVSLFFFILRINEILRLRGEAEIFDGYIIEIGVVGQQSNKDLKVALLAFPVTSGDSFVFEAKMFQRTIVIARHRFQNRRSSNCLWSIRFVHLEISPLRLVGRHRNIPNH